MIRTAFVVVFLAIFMATAALAIGGMAGLIQIPERYDKHFGKLVWGLLGEVAVAVIAVFASLNFADDPIDPTDPVAVGGLLSPPPSTWLPIDRDTGLPVDLTLAANGDTLLPIPGAHAFGGDLAVLPDSARPGRYGVVHERLPDFRLGLLDTGDLNEADLLGFVDAAVDDLTIRRVYVDSPFSDPSLPFGIALYQRGEALRFTLTAADTVVVDRAANKELHRVLAVGGESFLVAVVLSVPAGVPAGTNGSGEAPFAEFAIGRITTAWASQ